MLKKTFQAFKPLLAIQGQKIPMFAKYTSQFQYKPMRFYTTDGIILRDLKNGYFLDPQDVARRLSKLIALHDKCKDPSQITLGSSFHELGLDDLAVVEVLYEAENEFNFEFPDEDVERFRTVQDAVEYIARSFFAA
mmetsp:Transcript_35430/g.31918  ORF Transcript_35430/g.31918 Transcript_35430/m.31918 type:complete len:136 (-) Transcript_35430:160-567(-)|eukprot:CAMPEP_0114593334 /NCGR_PEP_ID=MMETSP0125-20121206/14950_1 /TAXON_ID=485358 ORGANISM="Aristerostoma sp., Strain ATCC 50986" /NCGR_SAMPLE_ID=MMETSP0125 /ASSEMBLY_ACC=CAM_ASM_000245 /LENGTH=135 /DNA_ID=CAMNT_0001792453 /DNA_START=39 /DNA_END=446 /DNA_ORIENTATION=-